MNSALCALNAQLKRITTTSYLHVNLQIKKLLRDLLRVANSSGNSLTPILQVKKLRGSKRDEEPESRDQALRGRS